MVWAARSGTSVFIPLSSTIAFSSTRIPKTRSEAHRSPQKRTGSSPESASCAAASRPAYPAHPVYRCFVIYYRCTGYTGLFLAERRPVIQGNLTSATDHRAGQLLVQRLPVLFILSILFIDVLFSFSSCAFVSLRGYLFCLCGLRATLSYHWSEMRVSCGKQASASL